MKKDPQHERALEELLKVDVPELKRRLTVTDWNAPGFVASEVMASIVRGGYQPKVGFLDHTTSVLYERLMRAVERFLRQNPQWSWMISTSSESIAEMTSEIWTKIVTDRPKKGVSLAEVRFWPFVEARAIDYLKSLAALKHTRMVSLETMAAVDDEGHETPWENMLEADGDDGPEAVVARKRLHESVMKRLMELPPLERQAVYYRLEFQYDWETTVHMMGCSVPTARKHYNRGLTKLLGVIE